MKIDSDYVTKRMRKYEGQFIGNTLVGDHNFVRIRVNVQVPLPN